MGSTIIYNIFFSIFKFIPGDNFSSAGIAGNFASRYIFIGYTLFLVETMNGLL